MLNREQRPAPRSRANVFRSKVWIDVDENESQDRGAVAIISNPQHRAPDAQRVHWGRDRPSLAAEAVRISAAVQADQLLRFALLELLHDRRRTEPRRPG